MVVQPLDPIVAEITLMIYKKRMFMEIIEKNPEAVEVRLSIDELNILIKAIDKVSNTLSKSDFKVRLGVYQEEAIEISSSLLGYRKNNFCADIKFTSDEIYILKNLLNEVCNGIKIIDFESELGVSREKCKMLLQSFKNLINSNEMSLNENADSFNIQMNKSPNNPIGKEKVCLNTEGYQVYFYLRKLDNSQNRVGIVLVFNLNSSINEVTIKTNAQSAYCEDLQSMIKYIENHINSLQQKSSNDSSTFLDCQKYFQIQALSGNLISEDKGSFPLRFMINVSYQDIERSTNTYVGAEALVSLKNIKIFVSSLKTALNKLCLHN